MKFTTFVFSLFFLFSVGFFVVTPQLSYAQSRNPLELLFGRKKTVTPPPAQGSWPAAPSTNAPPIRTTPKRAAPKRATPNRVSPNRAATNPTALPGVSNGITFVPPPSGAAPNQPTPNQPAPNQPAPAQTMPRPVRVPVKPVRPEKNENARRILVIGDFMASALAFGLLQTYANDRDVVVINRANGSSGLVRDDYYNWPKQLLDVIAKEKPDIILVMLGANDNQDFRNVTTDAIGSDAWTIEYQARVDRLAKELKESGKPWLWVGAPAFTKPNLTQTLVAFNALYKHASEANGGQFIDIWEGFVDSDGNFTPSGYDANGNVTRLRTNDGISFTNAGERKLAFYTEKPLKQLLSPSAVQFTSPPPVKKTPAKTVSPNDKSVAPMKLEEMAKQNQALIDNKKIANNKQNSSLSAPSYPGRADYFGIKSQGVRKGREKSPMNTKEKAPTP